MVWRPDDVKDALQNAVLRAFKAFDRYRDDASFKSWMFRILTNEIFTINRRYGRVSKFEVQVEDSELDTLSALEQASDYTDWLTSPEALAEALDENILNALGNLSEVERAVLLLRAIGGFRYQEIRDTLGIPMGSVMGHLYRARHKMRDVLRKRGVGATS
jgi:RNA polymerase sigma-70 factor (ECF subfamily)